MKLTDRLKLRLIYLIVSYNVCDGWIFPGGPSRHSSASFCKAVNRKRKNLFQLHEFPHDNKLDLNLLLIDHYDSFTFNLVDILAQHTIHPPTVVSTDYASTWDELMSEQLKVNNGRLFDGVILSPGPGHPDDPMYALSRDCVRQNNDIPILGVCLGHQILGAVYGAKVDLAPEPVHGQVRNIQSTHNNFASMDPLWDGIPLVGCPIGVTRYHSLHVFELKGTNLVPTTITDDSNSILMSMRHKDFPHFGLQFHPESIGTNETGKKLLHNFVTICSRYRQDFKSCVKTIVPDAPDTSVMALPRDLQLIEEYRVFIHKVPNLPPNGSNMRPLDVANEILCDEPYYFWLDEAKPINDDIPGISLLGASNRRVEYWGKEKGKEHQGLFVLDDNTLLYKNKTLDIVTYLSEQSTKLGDYATIVSFDDNVASFESRSEDELSKRIPFDFRGGHVGYFGYEVRHDTQRYNEIANNSSSAAPIPTIPTAAFIWADKSFVFDHRTDEWYLVGVHSNNEGDHSLEKSALISWMRSMSIRLSNGLETRMTIPTHRYTTSNSQLPLFSPSRTKETYNRNFAQCMEHILQGESYELCLTNQFECRVPHLPAASPFDLYKILRRRNPAPFSAYFHWNPSRSHASSSSSEYKHESAVSICCTSPERFVSIEQRRHDSDTSPSWEVEAKPIKGTIQRILPSNGSDKLTKLEHLHDQELAHQLQSSVKDRAENLMIVDLLRNDLSQVCKTGSVHVSKLMDIESYTTVHQMVSTIRGTLSDNKNAIDVLKACFPGGSMTGAPKQRTMALLHEIEDRACRGPYSGCLGYISLNGCMDMNIIIRTAIVSPEWTTESMSTSNVQNDSWKVSIGAGGAITALSKPSDEYDEMQLKASAIIGAVEEWVSISIDEPKEVAHQPDGSNEALANNATTGSMPVHNVKR